MNINEINDDASNIEDENPTTVISNVVAKDTNEPSRSGSLSVN